MAAETSWHRYGTKLRHCHPVYRPCTSPRPKLHLDRLSRFAGLTAVTERQRHAERERNDPIPSVAASGYAAAMRPTILREENPSSRQTETGATAAEKLEGTSRGVDVNPLLFLPVPFPSPVIAPPMFHPLPSLLLFPSPRKFSKHVVVCFPHCPEKMKPAAKVGGDQIHL